MSEQQKKQEKHGLGGGQDQGQDWAPDQGAVKDADIMVSHGPYCEKVPMSGSTAGDIFDQFQDRFDIDPEAEAYVNGQKVAMDYEMKAGEVLMFTKRAGEKGA